MFIYESGFTYSLTCSCSDAFNAILSRAKNHSPFPLSNLPNNYAYYILQSLLDSNLTSSFFLYSKRYNRSLAITSIDRHHLSNSVLLLRKISSRLVPLSNIFISSSQNFQTFILLLFIPYQFLLLFFNSTCSSSFRGVSKFHHPLSTPFLSLSLSLTHSSPLFHQCLKTGCDRRVSKLH